MGREAGVAMADHVERALRAAEAAYGRLVARHGAPVAA
jgi:hypothetical protein